MVFWALVAAATTQTYMGVRINLPLQDYYKPVLGFTREIAVGVLGRHDRLRYNIYKYTVVSRANIGNQPVLDYVDERIGDISWDITPAKEAGRDAFMLAAGGSVVQVLNVPRSKEKPRWTNVAKRWFWVSKEGKLLRDSYQLSTPGGAWTMDARFDEDQIHLTFNTPTETRQEDFTPKEGLAPFDRLFQPMLSKGKRLATSKEFQMLDPFTGGPLRYKAYVGGRFTSNSENAPGKGYVVEIKGPGINQKAYIRDDDELLKVELPNDRWIEASFPKILGGG